MASLSDLARPARVDDARHALMDTVRQLALAEHFSRAQLKIAERLAAQSQAWYRPPSWFLPDGSRARALQGEVEEDGATRRVTVYLYPLFGRTAVGSQCDCGQTPCHHAAALLLRLQQLLDWPRAMTPLQRWRQGLDTLRAPSPSTGHPPEARPLVCLLQVEGDEEPGRMTVQLVLPHGKDGLASRTWWPAGEAKARPHLSRQALLWQAQLDLTQTLVKPGGFYRLAGADGARLLEEFLQAGICRHARTLQPIEPGESCEPPWQWSPDADAHLRLGMAWPASQAARVVELEGLHYLDELNGRYGPLELSPATWAVVKSLPPLAPTETIELTADWPPHPLLAVVPPPPVQVVRRVEAPLRAVALLGASRDKQRGDLVFHIRALADYAGHRLPLAHDPWRHTVLRTTADALAGVQRDIEAELHAQHALDDAGFMRLDALLGDARRQLEPPTDASWLAARAYHRGGAETFASVQAQLQALGSAGVVLEYDPDLPYAVLPHETPLQATLDAGERPGWTCFELSAQLDGGTVDVLPIVLQGLAGRAFSLTPVPGEAPDAYWLAPLGGDRWLPLPLAQLREWLAPLAEQLPQASSRHASLTRAQALGVCQALQGQGIALGGAQATELSQVLASLRAALEATAAASEPTSFQGTLRAYQRIGLRWLQALRHARLGGVLADDMGLGKTVQIIAHLLLEHEAGRLVRPALIVAPTSLVFNWLDELSRFAPSLHCLNLTGSDRKARIEQLSSAQVAITSYALLAVDAPALESIDFALLVLDEAQWIKNPLTQAAQAVRRLCADHRLAVTGTPLENHLGELWAHMDAVLPGYLGDRRSFHRIFRLPIERQGDETRRLALRRRIAPFLLRRSKAEVAPELPPKTETVLRVTMDERQRRLYESLRLAQSVRVREALASYRAEQSRIVVLSALLRLRQVCCDPRLIQPADVAPPSAKLDALLELVQTLRGEGRRILIFSQFTSMLALIAQALQEHALGYDLLTGRTADRAAPVRRFQHGDVPILLASLKAGGVGLNLTAADAVIHYDPWWNPAVERQAVDRAHRLGRTEPVLVYRLLCEDTVEEKIEAMTLDKRDLAETMLDAALPAARLDDLAHALFDLPSPVAAAMPPSP